MQNAHNPYAQLQPGHVSEIAGRRPHDILLESLVESV